MTDFGVTGAPRPAITPARQASLREHNLGMVLDQILNSGSAPSRADISARTGLTRATVSALADRLIAGGLVAELAPVSSQRAGRPAVPLVPAPRSLAAVGLEVNVDYLGVRAIDLTGAVLAENVTVGDFRHTDPIPVLDQLGELFAQTISPLVAEGLPLAGDLCGPARPGRPQDRSVAVGPQPRLADRRCGRPVDRHPRPQR